VTEYAAPFDRVRIQGLENYHFVLRSLGDVKGSLVEGVVDLNIDRVGNEGKILRVVIYLPMSGTESKGLSPLTRIGIL
jgi:hypothetical protein